MKKTNQSQVSKSSAGSTKGNVLGQVAESVKEDLKATPSEMTNAVMRDAKQAVNYEIRKGFRSLLNNIFFKK